MTDETTPHDATTSSAVPDHNRAKVYVDGPDGIRVPFVEVSLSDSPAKDGPTPNAPVRLYDTSGPGVRLAVKDLIDMAGEQTTAGCRAVKSPCII